MTIGDPLPEFALPGVDGHVHGPATVADAKVVVLVQMCNHCPYVIGYQERMCELARRYAPAGVAFLGINSNDAAKYPSDSFENMQVRAREVDLPFPYLHDAAQTVASSLGTARTPEFLVFDAARRLAYRGRLDDNLEEPDQVTAHYLADALEALLAGRRPTIAETPPVGCTVKWR